MTLSDLSINRPVFAWMCMAGLIVFGVISFKQMGISQLPDADRPVVSVSLSWSGAAPEVMESDVVDPVEQALTSIQGIRNISSSVRQGQASVNIELDLERDVDFAVQEIQAKLAQAQRRLPDDIDPPVVSKSNTSQQPIIWLTLSGDRPSRELMSYMQDHLQDKFSTISGVGEVSLGGFVAPNLRVWLDAEKLTANELTVEDVINAIRSEHAELPAGRIETPTTEQNVRAMGEASTAQEFEDIGIYRRGGGPVYTPIRIKDVATVEDGLDDVRRISRCDGKPAIGLGIRKQSGANEVAIGRAVAKKFEQVGRQIPEGMRLRKVIDRTKFIEESINELLVTLVLSAIVTSLVCWLFLGSWSATVNILMAIPTSIIGTFIVINFLGFTLNTFTVLGLSLAIGIVVDDAIMVLENIVRHREQGAGQIEAAREGARQITFAALAATLAIIAIFLPVAFMTGVIGKFFYQFGITISVAVALSLLEALMLTPMRCAQFLQAGERVSRMGKALNGIFDRLAKGYEGGLTWALRQRWWVISSSLVFFVMSLVLFVFLPKEFVPPQDQSMFTCSLQTPVGSSIEYTDEKFKVAEKFIMSRPEVKHYFSTVGGFGGGQVNRGNIFVTLHPLRERPIAAGEHKRLSQGELMKLFRTELKKIDGLKAQIQDPSLAVQGGGGRGFPVEMSIQGPDWLKLKEYSSLIKADMERNKLFVDLDTDYLSGGSEVRVVPDRAKAAQYGVSVSAINETINAAIGGVQVAQYTQGGRRYDVRVRLMPQQRSKPDDIAALRVWNNHGEMVQLKEMVSIEEREAEFNITRRNRERAIAISANVAAGQSQATAITSAGQIAKAILPDGYTYTFIGSTQTSKESSGGLAFVFIMGIVVAYMVLASQFNSYVHPLSVLVALPFSISGALIALQMGGQSINLYSVIGLILLMGIVKKNSILLVDFTNQTRAQGLTVLQALIKACPIRLRPVLMTSAATVAAAIPPALALGPGAEVRIPMSIAVIGGVIVSTFLTLFVVPCVYSLFSSRSQDS